MFDTIFFEIAIVLITAGVFSLIASFLRQPLIIAYIATGLVLGPGLLDLASEPELFEAFSQIGIAFLLFLVGLHLNWRNVKEVGFISIIAGLGQVIFTSAIGWWMATLFGFDSFVALLIGIAFAFSSTIIIVKLLSDKEDIDRFYGRVSVGILIVQDLVAMLLLLVVGAMGNDSMSLQGLLLQSSVKFIGVLLCLFLIAKYVLPIVFRYAAKSSELLFLIAISWCFALASALHLLGFGIEIGALLAGLTLAGSEFHREIDVKIRPLRDFFIVIFFIVLGTHLSFDALEGMLAPALAFSAFILIGNPLIVIILLRLFNYHPRTGFLAGLTLAQVSEFSFILLASAMAVGLVDESVLSLATIVALITIAVSTYLIKYNEQIYEKLRFLFAWMETEKERDHLRLPKAPDTIMFGYHRIGEQLIPTIKKMSEDFMVVDIDPATISFLEENEIRAIFGDASNPDLLRHLRAEKSKMIISTIPDISISRDILAYLKQKKSRATVILGAKTSEESMELYELGAHFVIVPNLLGGEHFASLLSKKKTRKASWGQIAKKQMKLLTIR